MPTLFDPIRLGAIEAPNRDDVATWYSQGDKGYLDHPTLAA